MRIAGQAEAAGQSAEKDIEPAIEFGLPVVDGPCRRELTQVRELVDRQTVQPEPEHVIGFLGAFDYLLQFG